MSTFNKYRTKGAYHYDWYETEDWYKWAVDKCVKFCKGWTIDLGAGDGLVSTKIAENGHNVIAVENDPFAIELIKKHGHGNISILPRDIDYEGMTSAYGADYLCCLNVIEHLNKPERIKEIIRKNIHKGAIIITIDWQGGAFGEDHKKEYTLDELVDFFKEFNPKGFRYKNTEWIGVEIKK